LTDWYGMRAMYVYVSDVFHDPLFPLGIRVSDN
jgi:hypothetical protein